MSRRAPKPNDLLALHAGREDSGARRNAARRLARARHDGLRLFEPAERDLSSIDWAPIRSARSMRGSSDSWTLSPRCSTRASGRFSPRRCRPSCTCCRTSWTDSRNNIAGRAISRGCRWFGRCARSWPVFPCTARTFAPNCGEVGDDDRRRIQAAVRTAKRRNPAMSPTFFDFIASVLLLEEPRGALRRGDPASAGSLCSSSSSSPAP